MFSNALPLALATISPAVPAASVTSGAAIAVCFSPEEDSASFAARAIDNAEREILIGAYGLTTGSGIVEALVRAKGRGVRCPVDRRQDHAVPGYEWYRAPRRCRRADLDRQSGADRSRQNDGYRRGGHRAGIALFLYENQRHSRERDRQFETPLLHQGVNS